MTSFITLGLTIAFVTCIFTMLHEAMDFFKPKRTKVYYAACLINSLMSAYGAWAVWQIM